ncbi:hypothetical protein [Dialister invisus]|nr:hypothetical protein [Dialister invisus]
MYELKIQADNELKQYDIAVKGFDDKFFSLAVAETGEKAEVVIRNMPLPM